MPNRHATGRRDLNEKEITAVLKAAGKTYIQLHEGDGADLLVIDNPMFFVEIKRHDLPPSKTQLTPDELRLQELCDLLGIDYFVIKTPEQMAVALAWRVNKQTVTIISTADTNRLS